VKWAGDDTEGKKECASTSLLVVLLPVVADEAAGDCGHDGGDA
jgi:hypothetical protein